MILKVLGTQSPYHTPGHHCPGFLITDGEMKIMLDCGSGSHGMLKLPDDLKNLSVILSHLHRDHYNDIFNIQYAAFVFHNQKRLAEPVAIYLPATPERIFSDITAEESSYAEYTVISEATVLKRGDAEIAFCRTDHPAETYAVRISCGEKTVVYTSDTSFSCKDRLAAFAENADLLICECSLLTSYGFPETNPHLTARQAATIAKEAGAGKLLLTHFWPEESPERYEKEAKTVFSETVAAREGQIIELA